MTPALRGRRRREAEFLPAALEIEESPPSPLGRALAASIALLLVASVAWAVVGRVDVVAVARGKVIPAGHPKIVQPLESGLVRAIRVKDGESVRAGSVLVELDPTVRMADHDRLVHEQRSAEAHVARLRALVAGEPQFSVPPGVPDAVVALQQRLLAEQLAELRVRLEAARLVIEQRRAAVQATLADIERLEAIVPILTERSDAFRKLLAGEYVARMQYLEVEQERITRVQELAAQRQRLVRDEAALAEAQEQQRLVGVEFGRAHLAELTEWESRATSLGHEVVKAGQGSRVQSLRASVDGVVQQLAIHTVGGVVTPAQPLMVIVPTGGPLEVEAWLENKDVGFVQAGQAAEVKVDAFPFTRYGTIMGEVRSVSPDAVPQERGGLLYGARVSLDDTALPTEEGEMRLRPGMAVSVEIKTGERRLIEFVLSPLLRAWQESGRER